MTTTCDYCGIRVEVVNTQLMDVEPIGNNSFMPSEMLRVCKEHIVTLTDHRELPDRRHIYRMLED